MSGEKSLAILRKAMSPTMHDQTFVYCSFPPGQVPSLLDPICTFKEAEGMTAILAKSEAEAFGLDYQFECAMVTLAVHSSLDAVGLLAVVSSELARQGIPCNVVSAYYHDHLFVPEKSRQQVMDALATIIEDAA